MEKSHKELIRGSPGFAELYEELRLPAVADEIGRSLDGLPTVRRIDVVDFSEVSPDFTGRR